VEEDRDIHAELVSRAARLSRSLTLASVGVSLLLAFVVLYLVALSIEHPSRGKLLGIASGIAFVSAFLTSLVCLLWLSRRHVVSALREWIAHAVRRHGANADELEYIVGMYEKSSPLSQRAGLDEDDD
jgi:hypothetical protein